MSNLALRRAAARHPSLVLEPFDAIMEQYGFDAVCMIIDCFGGSTVYIPGRHTVFRGCLEKEAINNFNGSNYQALSRKYGISERHMRRMLDRKNP
ncbi:MAG: hypothetical protein FWC16_12985 [Defluviitaleaceae bacterium]|nr:hypothetical protein [Defluviitaleaceae bacterium]MCL2275835.1 hypothetical protein [Defluviitaleaceae bacterium]